MKARMLRVMGIWWAVWGCQPASADEWWRTTPAPFGNGEVVRNGETSVPRWRVQDDPFGRSDTSVVRDYETGELMWRVRPDPYRDGQKIVDPIRGDGW